MSGTRYWKAFHGTEGIFIYNFLAIWKFWEIVTKRMLGFIFSILAYIIVQRVFYICITHTLYYDQIQLCYNSLFFSFMVVLSRGPLGHLPLQRFLQCIKNTILEFIPSIPLQPPSLFLKQFQQITFLRLHIWVYIFCTVFILLPLSLPLPSSHWCQPPLQNLSPLASPTHHFLFMFLFLQFLWVH
jgi:hypothetical protein